MVQICTILYTLLPFEHVFIWCVLAGNIGIHIYMYRERENWHYPMWEVEGAISLVGFVQLGSRPFSYLKKTRKYAASQPHPLPNRKSCSVRASNWDGVEPYPLEREIEVENREREREREGERERQAKAIHYQRHTCNLPIFSHSKEISHGCGCGWTSWQAATWPTGHNKNQRHDIMQCSILII